MTQRDILVEQLREGNMGAGAYFTRRVELYLQGGDALGLHSFMDKFWPAFKEGYDAIQGIKLANGEQARCPYYPGCQPEACTKCWEHDPNEQQGEKR